MKDLLNYRRGHTWAQCGQCDSFVGNFEVRLIGGGIKCIEPRCKIIGLQHGRAYRVHPDSICDSYNNGERLAQLRGEKA